MPFPRLIVLVLLTIAASADEVVIDPWATLDPRHQFTCLARLEAPLAAAPDDQRLLGLAIIAYIHLALPAPRVLTGDPGSLLAKADALRDRRIKARGGVPPADLVAALPELWLAALHGDTRMAMDGLARHPDAEADSVARALRTFATRDWRGPAARIERTPLENYALAWAMTSCGFSTGEQVLGLKARGLSSPAINAVLPTFRFQGWSSDHITAAIAVIADACWLLGSPSLDDRQALELATRFHELAGWTMPADEARETRRRRMMTAARRTEENAVRPLLAAWWLCDHLVRTVGSTSDHRRLITLADAARWNRDRLVPLLKECLKRHGSSDQPEPEEKAERKLVADAGDGLLQHWSSLRSGPDEGDPEWPDLSATEVDGPTRSAALAGVTQDLADAHGHSAGVHWDLLVHLAAGGPLGDLPRRLAGRQEPDIIARRRWCAVVISGSSEPDAGFRRRLADWEVRDPWDPELNAWRQFWSPTAARLAFSTPPVATWTDAVIDNIRLPWPPGRDARISGATLQEDFLIRWDGWIRLPKAGRWRFTVASDDGSRLVVGDTVVDQWRYQGLTSRGVDWDCQAGWLPLRVDYFQGHGDAGCRLLWRPPGTDEDSVVPAEFLAHGPEHAAGLIANCWLGSADVLRPLSGGDQDTWLRERQWLLHDWCDRGHGLALLGCWAEAVPWLDLPLPPGIRNVRLENRQALGYSLLMRDPPAADPTRAIALLASSEATVLHGNDIDGPWLIADRAATIGISERLKIALDQPECSSFRQRSDGSWHVLHGLCALRQGDFNAALVDHRWLTREEHQRFLSAEQLRLIALQDLALARLGAERDIDLARIDTLLTQGDIAGAPNDVLARDYLTGSCDAATARKRAASLPQPTTISYWLGLQALAEHRFTDARTDLATAASGTGNVAVSATALTAWLARQPPERLDALPRSAPIPLHRLPATPTSSKGGADDF